MKRGYNMSYQVMDHYVTIWGLVIYGTGNEYWGVDTTTAAKISECSKFFHLISISSDIAKCYWKGNVIKYFNVFYQEDLLNKVDMTFRELFFSYSAKMMNVLRSCDEQKSYTQVYNLLNPLIKHLSEPYANSRAQFELAYCYSCVGLGYPTNIKDSFKLYQLSANQGYSKAEERLGYIYEFGRQNQLQNYNLSFNYYKLAADHRIQEIYKKLKIDLFAEMGRTQRVSLKDASRLYIRNGVYNKNNREILFSAARCHEEGIGTVINLKTALKYYRVLATPRNVYKDRIILKVAQLYEKGTGTLKNVSQAIKYYKAYIKNLTLEQTKTRFQPTRKVNI